MHTSALHPDPGKHALESWVLIKPVVFSSISGAEVGNNHLVGDSLKLLYEWIELAFVFFSHPK